jgi:uncharacterized protein
MTRDLAWAGAPGTFRVEIAHVEPSRDGFRARGTQIAVEDTAYELRYEVDADRLLVEVVGGRSLDLGLDGADFFDLAASPLFNSFPVVRHGLHRGGEARDFVMAWVSVPDLAVSRSEQRYDPLAGEGLVRFSSASFTADIEFDRDGFVVHYPDLAERVYPERAW